MATRQAVGTAGVIAVTFALGATFAGGVGAVAVAKSTSVKACETKHGDLATATKHKCPKGTHALKLGVKGPRGPKGLPGEPGTPGSNGLSTALIGTDVSTSAPFSDSAFTTVETISQAPAGTYIVDWNYAGYNAPGPPSPSAGLLQCRLTAAGNDVDSHGTGVPPALGSEVAGTTPVILTTPGPISVRCDIIGGSPITPYGGDLVAIRVDSATVPPAAG